MAEKRYVITLHNGIFYQYNSKIGNFEPTSKELSDRFMIDGNKILIIDKKLKKKIVYGYYIGGKDYEKFVKTTIIPERNKKKVEKPTKIQEIKIDPFNPFADREDEVWDSSKLPQVFLDQVAKLPGRKDVGDIKKNPNVQKHIDAANKAYEELYVQMHEYNDKYQSGDFEKEKDAARDDLILSRIWSFVKNYFKNIFSPEEVIEDQITKGVETIPNPLAKGAAVGMEILDKVFTVKDIVNELDHAFNDGLIMYTSAFDGTCFLDKKEWKEHNGIMASKWEDKINDAESPDVKKDLTLVLESIKKKNILYSNTADYIKKSQEDRIEIEKSSVFDPVERLGDKIIGKSKELEEEVKPNMGYGALIRDINNIFEGVLGSSNSRKDEKKASSEVISGHYEALRLNIERIDNELKKRLEDNLKNISNRPIENSPTSNIFPLSSHIGGSPTEASQYTPMGEKSDSLSSDIKQFSFDTNSEAYQRFYGEIKNFWDTIAQALAEGMDFETILNEVKSGLSSDGEIATEQETAPSEEVLYNIPQAPIRLLETETPELKPVEEQIAGILEEGQLIHEAKFEQQKTHEAELDSHKQERADADAEEKAEADELDLQAVKDKTQAMMGAYDALYSGISELMGESAAQNEAMAVFQKSMTLFNIGLSTAEALANVTKVRGVTAFDYAIQVAIAVGTVLSNIARARKVLSEEKQPKAPKFASGGLISGAGSGTSDSIPALLSNGESVMTARSTAMFSPILSAFNQLGGGVPFSTSQVSSQVMGEEMLSRAFARAVQQMPSPVVSVEEINTTNQRVQVLENYRSL